MEKKKTGISYVFQLAKDERKKLHLGMFLSVISANLSLVPYFVVYKILLMIFQKNILYTEILMWAGIGIISAVLQAILMSFAGILSHTAAYVHFHVEIKLDDGTCYAYSYDFGIRNSYDANEKLSGYVNGAIRRYC